ncbi:MAG TPA: Ig-like domain repeat protein, partial [Acidobacteriaceae bacterium]
MTSVAAGTVVTLTAHVAAGAKAVTPGQVNFCDASARSCADIHLLGTAQLNSAGTATLKLRPGIGSHSYKAIFVGTKTYAQSASEASALTATGTIPQLATATSISQTGSWGAYTLSSTVTETGNTAPPAG